VDLFEQYVDKHGVTLTMPYYTIAFDPQDGFSDWIESIIGRRPVAISRKSNPSRWSIEFDPDLTPAERTQLRSAMPQTLQILFSFTRNEGTLIPEA